MNPRYPGLALFAAALLGAVPAHADGWKQEFAPYLWGASMDGTSGVGGVTADVDQSFSDIMGNLELGFMGGYRATKDRYSILSDVVYMGLGVVQRGPGGLLKADVDLDQLALEVDGGYALADHFTVFGGLRYNDINTRVRVTGPLDSVRQAKGSENWVDPVVGAIYTLPINGKWTASLRGDVGGFGLGSDFAWQGLASLRWQSSPTFGVIGAYRYMAMDYDNGSGAHRFKYDMAMSGPGLGMVFSF